MLRGLSRFSFMGDASGPFARSAIFHDGGQSAEVRDGRGEAAPRPLGKSVFEYLEEFHRTPAVHTPAGLDCPFVGGHVGFFGYELKRLTCGAAAHEAPTPDAAFLFADRLLAFDHRDGIVHAIALAKAGDAADRDAAQQWVEETIAALGQVREPAPPAPEPAGTPPRFRLRHDRAAYLARIKTCLEEIAAGESYEICLTNTLEAEVDLDPLDLYRILRRRNPAPYSAFLRFGDLAIASSSPERFLRIDPDGSVETKPIKGTERRDSDPARDAAIAEGLRLDEKSRSENLMIVDLMRNDLGRVCETGSVHVPSLMHVESYETVHQLVSVVRGRIRAGESPVSCIASCFPGGSMTGAPKVRTLEIIDRLEEAARGVYSGAIGYLSLTGAVDLNIVIRTVVCTPGDVSIGCGGAIVYLSDPQAEFDEILLKAQAPMAAVAEAAGAATDTPPQVANAGQDRPDLAVNGGIRAPRREEAAAVGAAVEALLRELGGPGPQFRAEATRAVCEGFCENERDGFIRIAETEGGDIAGVALVSVVRAARTSGDYAVLQELWVDVGARGSGVGAALLAAVDAEARRRGLPQVEVSLPKPGHPHAERLQAFYARAGYAPAGQRMRRSLA
ncbi:aminodeoxychorismate synthase component I [Stappia sp. ES.058]|uniref:aminodeoxychorismate synthase component I n=1 Tax=Stappia sp. ES.058 TaxID=1881061 RepID=UPI001FCD3880|nr:aminodeoxychorismate synthase component I [Stappia sp. ES.058]